MLANVAGDKQNIPVAAPPRPRARLKKRQQAAQSPPQHKQARLSRPQAAPVRKQQAPQLPPASPTTLGQKHQGRDAFIKWSAELSVQVQLIDQQHLRLVNITNALYCAARDKKGLAEVGRIFHELLKYTAFHFNDEERKMASVGYPGLAAHQQLHKKLLTQVNAFKARLAKGEEGIEKAVLKFLKAWLLNHIAKEDAKYSPYFHKKGIR